MAGITPLNNFLGPESDPVTAVTQLPKYQRMREGVIAPFLAFVPDNGFKSVCQLKWVYSITHPHSDVHRTHLILITHLW